MAEPRELIQQIEAGVELPSGTAERFSGYGVMGLTFSSGHVLGLRRFPASSVGPGYTSFRHRNPEGAWRMYQTAESELARPRYFGSVLADAGIRDVSIASEGPFAFSVRTEGVEWQVELAAVPETRLMNAVGSVLPESLWRNERFLGLMAAVAGPVLRAGKIGLSGKAPNGQSFIANPRTMWVIPSSRARVDGQDLGPVGPLATQASLGDFLIPQRGMFVIGQAFFEPTEQGAPVPTPTEAASG